MVAEQNHLTLLRENLLLQPGHTLHDSRITPKYALISPEIIAASG
jgi:hypothetical protein